ncbi:MAG: hypothetical protein CMN76_17570 [Spirochaetaceae bacterium]|nr:hypothetical protein [Spirochaetaceae bacterium]|tara:strand:- start:46823 stop:47707 length:885 start_codon:yes stop_codon:yes gene_type:complete
MYRYEVLDVFTEERFSGNPLAVFPEADRIPASLFQSIAREMNLSETIFILPPSNDACDYRFRIFTPARELDFAGHPVIGAACALAAKAETSALNLRAELNAGKVEVTVTGQGDLYHARLQAPSTPVPGPPPPPAPDLARILGIETGIVSHPAAYSCGNPFLFVELDSRQTLSSIRLNLAEFEGLLLDYWAPEIMAFVVEKNQVHARMFAPRLGIPEDPATGSAVAALAGYLKDVKLESPTSATATHSFIVFQGYDMGRPSRIDLEFRSKSDVVDAVFIGGCSVPVAHGTFLAGQ